MNLHCTRGQKSKRFARASQKATSDVASQIANRKSDLVVYSTGARSRAYKHTCRLVGWLHTVRVCRSRKQRVANLDVKVQRYPCVTSRRVAHEGGCLRTHLYDAVHCLCLTPTAVTYNIHSQASARNQMTCSKRPVCAVLTLASIALALQGVVAQIVAEAPGPGVSMTRSDAPLTQSSEAMCRAKLGGTSQTLIMVADPGDFTGTGMTC